MFGWRFTVALLPLAALIIGVAVVRRGPRFPCRGHRHAVERRGAELSGYAELESSRSSDRPRLGAACLGVHTT
jgi:hypothetical protein